MLFALGAVMLNVVRHPQYTPDGIVYARYAARDAGQNDRDATLSARHFYERTPMAAVPRYHDLIELDPSVAFARSRIFANRILYPWLVSLLLPFAGFRSLFIVSALAYIGFGIALFWLLAGLGRIWLAVLLTIVALALPLTRELAASDLTDMLAAVWWTLALGALLRAMKRPHPGLLVTLAVSAVLLTLTRPTPYLIVLPALVATALTGTWILLGASLASVVAYAAVAVSVHAFGVRDQLQWIYSHEPRAVHSSFAAWYSSALKSTVVYVLTAAVRTVLPALLVAAAIYGVFRTRMRDEMLVLLTAILAALIAVPFNPVPSAIARVLVFPLVPVFCAIAQCFAVAIERSPQWRPEALRR